MREKTCVGGTPGISMGGQEYDRRKRAESEDSMQEILLICDQEEARALAVERVLTTSDVSDSAASVLCSAIETPARLLDVGLTRGVDAQSDEQSVSLDLTAAGYGLSGAGAYLAADHASPEQHESTDLGPVSSTVGIGSLAPSGEPVVAMPGALCALDHFPVADLDGVPEFDDPDGELAALFRQLVHHKDYPAVRTRCCQISIRMNLRGAVAPAFRYWPRGVGGFHSKISTLIMRDQMVIDYHWCHARGMTLSPTDDFHKHLLDLETAFDFTMAWKLSGKLYKSAYRAGEALCLTSLQQCQTLQLRGHEVHERMERMYKGYFKSGAKSHSELAKVSAAIGVWIEKDPRIKQQRDSYLRLWEARELLGPGASIRSIRDLHALMLGVAPLDAKTIADKLNRLSKNVDFTLKPSATS